MASNQQFNAMFERAHLPRIIRIDGVGRGADDIIGFWNGSSIVTDIHDAKIYEDFATAVADRDIVGQYLYQNNIIGQVVFQKIDTKTFEET